MPNGTLDAPITTQELEQAIRNLKRNTATGLDGVTNSILRQLNDKGVESFLAYMNGQWLNHTLPQQWKHSTIMLIPKPGKELSFQNLRPISLTSCMGKLLEHILQDRVNGYLEHQLYPPNMLGFRPNLSTQDALAIPSRPTSTPTKDRQQHTSIIGFTESF